MKSQSIPKPVPLAIVGMGCIFPKAEDMKKFWANIENKVDAISEVPDTHWRLKDYFNEDPKTPDHTYGNRGGFLSPVDFNPMEFAITPRDLEAIDTSQLLGLVVAKKTLEDAGYWEGREFDREKVSVILGVTGTLELVIPLGARLGHPLWRKALEEAGADEELTGDVIKRIAGSYVEWQESSFPGLLGNVVAGRIANQLDLWGTNCVVDAACGSSLSALNLAMMELITGKSDMVLTGGVDTFNDIFMYMCFSKTPALTPTGDARPFDHKTDGTILGEGLGMVAIKRLEEAERDGDKIYAVIRGLGTSSDGKGAAIFAPRLEGQVRALKEAYRVTGINPRTIELIEAHGTGTPVGDKIELEALEQVFRESGEGEKWCAIGSVKSQVGHTKAAAGAAGLIKAALALHHKVLPPTIKIEKPAEPLRKKDSPFYINTEKRPWTLKKDHPRRAGVSSFGFGGSNYHCILEEYDREKMEIDWDDRVQILAFSANTREDLARKLESWPVDLSWKDLVLKAEENRLEFNPRDQCRLALTLEQGRKSPDQVISTALSMLEKQKDKASWSTPDGIYFKSGKPAGNVGMVFSGQGAQYVGMMRDLACQFPRMHKALVEADGDFEKNKPDGIDGTLADYIYPIPAFEDEERKLQEEELRDTRVAQPALGAVSLGAFHILQDFGVKPLAFAGHSYGELTALCAAGRITQEELNFLSALRGKLMAQGKGDLGTMMAVQSDLSSLEKILKENGLNLTIANRNAPLQMVLSGSREEIDRARGVLDGLGIRAKKIPVAAAFHSPLVSDAQKPFGEALRKIKFKESKFPVFSNTTGVEYPSGSKEAGDLLAGQLAKPVQFIDEITNMYRSGIRVFIEAGPGSRMAGLIKAVLADRDDITVISIDASNGKKNGTLDLARTLAALAAWGYELKLSLWNPVPEDVKKEAAKPKAKMTVPICGANYVSPQRKKGIPPRVKQAPAAKSAQAISASSQQAPVSKSSAPPAVPLSAPAQVSLPVSQPAPVIQASADNSALAQMLSLTRQNMMMLQNMQEQASQLHKQFLDNQNAAMRNFQALTAQQQNIIQTSLGMAPLSSASPIPVTTAPIKQAAPAPVFVPVQAPIAHVETPAVTPVSAPVETAVEPPASPVPGFDREKLAGILMGIVSEKTGYPAEMLEMEMNLDSDLGIDSIKRVEILSALKDRVPEAESIKAEHMGTLKTLADIAGFIADAAPAVSATAVPAASKAAPGFDRQKLEGILMGIVSEKTGYPAEMLEMGMNLDSDLGIDSIKRVEILSALKDRVPEAEAVKAEHMGTLKTLADITEFIANAAPAGSPVPMETPAGEKFDRDGISKSLMGIVSEKTGYPPEMLEMEMNLDSDLGIDSIKRVEILSALKDKVALADAIKAEHMGTLKTLNDIVNFLMNVNMPGAGAPLEKAVSLPVQETVPAKKNVEIEEEAGLSRMTITLKEISGKKREKISLPAGSTICIAGEKSPLADETASILSANGFNPEIRTLKSIQDKNMSAPPAGMIILSPEAGADDSFLKDSFRALRKVSPMLLESAGKGGAFFATVSRLDGAFGFMGMKESSDPLSGGLAGLPKTARHEWPEVKCKAVDLDPDFASDVKNAAAMLVEEILTDGPVEAGISGRGIQAPELVENPVKPDLSDFPIRDGEVLIITGGARGVTANCAVNMAKDLPAGGKPVFVLLGRSGEPFQEPPWLKGVTDEAGIKRAIMQNSIEKLSPKDLQNKFRSYTANREIKETLSRIESAGAEGFYRSVDVRDSDAVRNIVESIKSQIGPVKGFIHGAGVIADKLIGEKTDGEFDRVYDTKVAGLHNLMNALKDEDLKVAAFFSSSTGRVGRRGQVDYAMANEVLNKTADMQAKLHPSRRVVSINWGPWDGGMVTSSLKKIFLEEGVGVIPLKAGARCLAGEMSLPSSAPAEVVVQGLIRAKEPIKKEDLSNETDMGDFTIAFEKKIDPEELPFLKSHVIGGKAVMPMAVIMDWLGQGAMHANPGLKFHGLDNLQMLKGIKLEPGETRTLQVLTGKTVHRSDMFAAPMEIRSSADGKKFEINYRAEAVLANRLPGGTRELEEVPLGEYPGDAAKDYREILFHGPDFQGIEKLEGISDQGFTGIVNTAPGPSRWIKKPFRSSWITDPLVLDAGFQMMILWTARYSGAPSLPAYVGRYRQFRAFPKTPVNIRLRIIDHNEMRARAHMEFTDQSGNLIARMEGYECVTDSSLEKAFRENALPGVAVV